jgi:membrane protein implicated in regulation of membrane protease activity
VPGRNLSTVCKVLLALSVLLLGADRAMAYGGPGADVTFISYAMTLLAWALAAFSAVLLWPAYALLRWARRRKNKPTTASSPEAAPEEARAVSHTDS